MRSLFRVAELKSGFDGKLANEEIPFMILEGGMMLICTLALTVLHPGIVFKKGWKKGTVEEMMMISGPMRMNVDGETRI